MTTENTQKTVQLSQINSSLEGKENFFEKGVRKFVSFIAKTTGQPDPKSSPQTNTPPEASSGKPATPNFFEKLVNSTENLLNKTENFANKAAEKTKNLTQSIREAPGKVVEKTNTVIDKGINLGEQVKSRAESVVNSGVDFGKNLQTTMTENAQKFAENPLQATGNMGKGIVSSTANLGKNLGEQAKDLGTSSFNQLREGAEQLEQSAASAGQRLHIDDQGNMQATATNIMGELKGKGRDALDKTKEIGKNMWDSATDVLKNPVEHLDALAGKGNTETPAIQTETENTTALENLETSK